jgi:hypothetical protein
MTTSIESAATTLRAPGIEFEFDDRRVSVISDSSAPCSTLCTRPVNEPPSP